MYIELFLLDNFLFDMLILRISSVICKMDYSHAAAALLCLFMSAYSAFAVHFDLLRSLPFKLLLCIIAAIPFYIKSKQLNLLPVLSVFISTLLAGGLVYCLNPVGTHTSPGYIRLLLYPASLLFLMSSCFRHLQRRVSRKEISASVCVFHDKKIYCFSGIYDSGCELCEPLSGVPVIILYAPALTIYGQLPISYRTAGGNEMTVYAFLPDKLYINDRPAHAYIAPLTADPDMPALIPWMCRSL